MSQREGGRGRGSRVLGGRFRLHSLGLWIRG